MVERLESPFSIARLAFISVHSRFLICLAERERGKSMEWK